jgi:dynein heavy chain
LFIGSAEVKRELPDDTARFAKIDVDTKNILKSCGDIGNVLRACTQDGLLNTLERLQGELAQCKKSLQDFLDGKRQQFPRCVENQKLKFCNCVTITVVIIVKIFFLNSFLF